MTMAPDCTAIGAVSSEIADPALKNARSISSKEFTLRVWTASSWRRNLKVFPAERAEARSFTDEAGKFRRSICINFDTHGASCADDCNSILSGHRERT